MTIDETGRTARGNAGAAAFGVLAATLGVSAMLLLLFARGESLYLKASGMVLAYLTIFAIALFALFALLAKMPIRQRLLRVLLYGGAAGVSTLMLMVVIGATWIGFDVKSQCQAARSEYGGDCTQALIRLVQDERRGFRVRNDAIWALGQLGDSRAQPVLQGLYTGNIPPREPLDEGISQYELRKAVDLTRGGANLLAVFWRYGIDD